MVFPGKGMSWKEFFKSLKDEYTRDKVGDVAGALTFSAILAIFPFLLFLVSLASVIIDPAQAEQLIQELARVAPKEVVTILGDRLHALAASNNVGLLTLGGVGAVWAASGGMVALMTALNTAYGVEESRPFWKVRGVALLVTLVTAAISILAAAAAVVTPALAEKVGGPFPTLVTWLRLPVAGVMMMFVWALLYYALPDVQQRFRFITPGSVAGVLIWLLASWGFSQYVANFGSYDANYGAIGGVIVLLMWMWISSQVILVGAEINAILEHRSPEGKSPGQKELGEAGPTVTKTEAEDQGTELPGSTEFRPKAEPPSALGPMALKDTPLVAAVKWAAGLGLGLFLLRRGTRSS
ncbi:YihY/virulence factor BrkB family protein [Stigmatella aurantiaca]|uniref:Ribonuclease BN n=1 Tax=Stigmatella aurantiaca (strain DW4/3-1) TaxID=378806 RepID=Q094X9_STIAD|nr:YihY/virulence factor BrkB family protein [Stigmatella aurantiaca]ADO71343.1 Ribonuclease BN [Stigmatella aurantiaca DW4/3-1]EAU67289.1 ribonuclease BN [Stigmatella aurantiaca DW4/3-1]